MRYMNILPNNITIDKIIKGVKEYNPEANIKVLKRAYEFAAMAHAGQKRLSGEE